jgi:virginiamycin B lyase
MNRAKLLTGTLVVAFAALLGVVAVGFVRADAPPHAAALTGTVSSQAEGAMEGVLVGAKRAGSTMATWVVSDAQGHFSFPADHVQPGKYAISIRAVGYELPNTSVDVTDAPARLDLQLNKIVSVSKLAMQLTNVEWRDSIPGTAAEKTALGCSTCHTLQRIMFSRFNGDEMVPVLQRMATHTNNSSPMHPWVRPIEGPAPEAAPRMIAQAKYIASINLSAQDTFAFPLKTLPRPHGKGTQVIYTTYDLPRIDAEPHDTTMDADGNVWYSDFTSQFIGKLDPRTGKVTEYPVPLARSGPYAQGGLQLVIDKQGRVYYGNMSQMQIVRLDPKTGKMETFKAPVPDDKIGTGHLTMIDPNFQDNDGELWINVADGTDESGGTYHIDLAKNVWTKVTYPAGSPSAGAYDVVANSSNNMYGMNMNNGHIWITDGKTLKTTWFDMTLKGAGCRRGHIDSQDRLWCGDFTGDGLAMFDPKTQKVTEWAAPTPGMWPYDAEYDDKAYTWFAGMESDLAVRFNTKTGEFVQYQLPHDTNVRHVDVQKSGDLSSLWLADQHSNLIVHIEPLTP